MTACEPVVSCDSSLHFNSSHGGCRKCWGQRAVWLRALLWAGFTLHTSLQWLIDAFLRCAYTTSTCPVLFCSSLSPWGGGCSIWCSASLELLAYVCTGEYLEALEVFCPNSCSELHREIRFFRALLRHILHVSKDGDFTTSLGCRPASSSRTILLYDFRWLVLIQVLGLTTEDAAIHSLWGGLGLLE